jgi:hypothetical protein
VKNRDVEVHHINIPKHKRTRKGVSVMSRSTLAWAVVAIVLTARSLFAEDAKAEKLIADLVAIGDAAFAKDKQSAQWAYSFAALFAPKDPDIKKKKEAVGDWAFNASSAERSQMDSALSHLSADNWKPWSDSNPEMVTVELRMLLDKQLVGDLHYADFRKAGVWGLVFVAKPTLTISEMIDRYGKPSAETKGGDGSVLVSFGRFRLVVDKSGHVAGVFFRRF